MDASFEERMWLKKVLFDSRIDKPIQRFVFMKISLI